VFGVAHRWFIRWIFLRILNDNSEGCVVECTDDSDETSVLGALDVVELGFVDEWKF